MLRAGSTVDASVSVQAPWCEEMFTALDALSAAAGTPTPGGGELCARHHREEPGHAPCGLACYPEYDALFLRDEEGNEL